jgi:predicted flap endonuclease-1-like 5' DNA nuclease
MMTAHWTCWLWTMLGAGLLGWGIKGVVLGTVMDDKRREMERLTNKIAALTKLANQPPEVRTVEKRVEVPVERVVMKRVEVPVEKVVDRPVDNPEHLARIKALEGEVAVIAGLFTQIAQLKTLSVQTEERRTEGQVVVPVDNPDQLERIKALEGEVAVIAELRAQIAELQAASSPAGEKVVKPRIESTAEQNGKMSIDKMREPRGDTTHAGAVESSPEGQTVDESPDDLKQIRGVGPALERFLHKRGVLWFSQVATWSHKDIDKFEFLLPNFGGRIQRENWVRSAQVEHYKKYQQWLGDGEPPSDSLEPLVQLAELQTTSSQVDVKVLEPQIEPPVEEAAVKEGDVPVGMISEPVENLDQASVGEPSDEGQAVDESPDDLKQIRGVGPGLERFLHKRGVFWFSQVATWSEADIDKFEFLLPNFGGRIQRENWVRSAQVEHYKKYKKWLGDEQPPSTTPETC